MSTPKTGSKKQAKDGYSQSKENGKQNPKESKTNAKAQRTQKPPDQKKSPILDVAAGVEGMTAPPADMELPKEGEEEEGEEVAEEGEEEEEEPHYNPWRRVVTSPPRLSATEQAARTYGTRSARPETARPSKKAGKSRQSKQSAKAAAGGSSRRKSSKGRQGSPAKKSSKGRQRSPDEDKEEEKPTTDVKQFAFPYYKILSGASVAPVRMLPQKIVIKPSCEPESRPGQWAAGLFQNTKMSVKLRLLRLFLVWLFFRMLNRQAMWLSEKLDLGRPDPADGIQRPPPSRPGEKYIRVFHEGKPNPFHMRFTPDMNPDEGFRPPPS